MNNGRCKPLLELWNRDPCSDLVRVRVLIVEYPEPED